MLAMNKLSDTNWDVVISGTGLAQSFLALALSRSGKNVLHIDKNGYYGGSEAAFSLQEAEEWVTKVSREPDFFPFESVSISRPTPLEDEETQLSFSRAYTLSLSPHLIYSRSKLLPTLVSSKVYRQLEFQAVGSWWVYRPQADTEEKDRENSTGTAGLQRVPSSREDVFADETMTMKSKRSLMKFLRYLSQQQSEDGEDTVTEREPEQDIPLQEFLQTNYQIPPELFDPLLSLALSPRSIGETSTRYALARLKRHLGSIGVYGPGFGSVLAKWGGGAEFCQVACRACAVGGGVYALDRGVKDVEQLPAQGDEHEQLRITLSNDECVQSRFLVGSAWDLPSKRQKEKEAVNHTKVSRSIMIVDSPLESMFPPTSENGPVPAGAVVIYPGEKDGPPVYLLIHSSGTGECPTGQCVIYGSVTLPSSEGQALIEKAAKQVLGSTDPNARILWNLRFTQFGQVDSKDEKAEEVDREGRIFSFPLPSLDLAFDDSVIEQVRHVWKSIMEDKKTGEDEDVVDPPKGFLVFEDRENANNHDGE